MTNWCLAPRAPRASTPSRSTIPGHPWEPSPSRHGSPPAARDIKPRWEFYYIPGLVDVEKSRAFGPGLIACPRFGLPDDCGHTRIGKNTNHLPAKLATVYCALPLPVPGHGIAIKPWSLHILVRRSLTHCAGTGSLGAQFYCKNDFLQIL